MNSLNRRCLLAVIAVLLLSLGRSAAAKAISHEGFMGIKWGISIRRFPGVDWNGWDSNWKMHVELETRFPGSQERLVMLDKVQDIKKFDGFPVSTILYHFLDMRFSGVSITFAKNAWIEDETYTNYLIDNFGQPTAHDDLNGIIMWKYDDGFVVILSTKVLLSSDLMTLSLFSPQEAKYRGFIK